MDSLTPQQRSSRMAAIRQKNTAPEVRLRRLLHAAGYRFRLHRRDLPGTPDIVFPARCKAIFVNGCFWHGHDCRAGRAPATNQAYWSEKITSNKRRDRLKTSALEDLGWQVLIVWECELKVSAGLPDHVATFLAQPRNPGRYPSPRQ
jgi:DNA mismatch endonuclease (patch repair protein)